MALGGVCAVSDRRYRLRVQAASAKAAPLREVAA
jgi:hypothetical protein